MIESKLNKAQKEAVLTTEGPVLIIAGPGSGKTSTLVERIIYLIDEKKVLPESIMISTFTEKAAKELITKITNRLIELNRDIDITKMYLGTIHSLCLRLIEENIQNTSLKKNYKLMDDFEQKYFIYQNLKKFEEIEGYVDLIGFSKGKWKQTLSIEKLVNKLSEENVEITKLENNKNLKVKTLGNLYKMYIFLLKKENLIDFPNIQVETFEMMNKNIDILEKIQNQIKYLMIDEYQDTNTIQEKIIFKIAEKQKNICVVGDDDQGLYRFRGATIRNILEFPENFKAGECKIIKLDINYRSHPDIVNFYDKWMQEINWGKYRYSKKMLPHHIKKNDSPAVLKVSGENTEEEWQNSIFYFIKKLKKSNKLTNLNQIAFLFKSVKDEKVIRLAETLELNGIPIYSPRAGMFFYREEIKLLIGGLIALFPQYIQEINETLKIDPESELFNYYKECIEEFTQIVLKDKSLREWLQQNASKHFRMSKSLGYSFSTLFYQILQFEPFLGWLDDSCLNGVKDGRIARNISIFSKLISKFEDFENIQILSPKYLELNIKKLFNVYLRFLINGGVEEYQDMEEYAPSGCVSFMTIHQSKGMEFPVVFVGSLDSFPKKQYTDLDKILQEEIYDNPPFEPLNKTAEFDFWRLYYTAFSRAQNLLILTEKETVSRKYGEKYSPSKYFLNVYNSLLDWKNKKFDWNSLELEKIKDVNIKKTYSFTSDILVYENCPREYKFFKELDFSPVKKQGGIFGSLVHQTIEDIHKIALEGKYNEINRETIYDWFQSNYEGLSKSQKSYLAPIVLESAFEQIMNYVDTQNNEIKYVKEAEIELSYIKNNYILYGVVDLIKEKNGIIEIVDFKSSKKPSINKDKRILEIYKRQLEVYSYLLEKQGKKVDKIKLYYTSAQDSNPYIEFKKDRLSINETIKIFDEIVDKIQKKDFNLKTIDQNYCKNCDMRFYCEKK